MKPEDLFEFDAPQHYVDLSQANGYMNRNDEMEMDPWFAVPHKNHTRGFSSDNRKTKLRSSLSQKQQNEALSIEELMEQHNQRIKTTAKTKPLRKSTICRSRLYPIIRRKRLQQFRTSVGKMPAYQAVPRALPQALLSTRHHAKHITTQAAPKERKASQTLGKPRTTSQSIPQNIASYAGGEEFLQVMKKMMELAQTSFVFDEGKKDPETVQAPVDSSVNDLWNANHDGRDIAHLLQDNKRVVRVKVIKGIKEAEVKKKKRRRRRRRRKGTWKASHAGESLIEAFREANEDKEKGQKVTAEANFMLQSKATRTELRVLKFPKIPIHTSVNLAMHKTPRATKVTMAVSQSTPDLPTCEVAESLSSSDATICKQNKSSDRGAKTSQEDQVDQKRSSPVLLEEKKVTKAADEAPQIHPAVKVARHKHHSDASHSPIIITPEIQEYLVNLGYFRTTVERVSIT